MEFTVLGPSGSGKTSLLASMYHDFEMRKPGTFTCVDDDDTFEILSQAYNDLQDMAESIGDEVSAKKGVVPGVSEREFNFYIFGNKRYLTRFFDFPGGWIRDSMHSQRVISIMQQSQVILVAVHTPAVMEEEGRYINTVAGINDIEKCIELSLDSLATNNNDKMILFIPIKSEKYTRSVGETKVLHEKIRDTFKNTLSTCERPPYQDRIAIATLPIHTVGNINFDRFVTEENGRVRAEVYRKNRKNNDNVFSPKNVDQPFRFLLSFLLKQDSKRSFGFLKKFFYKRGEIEKFVRFGMKIDSDDFDIIQGRNLII